MTIELSIVLSSLVSLTAIISILFSIAKISISSFCFVNDGALSEQISKPFRPVEFLILFTLVSFCLLFEGCSGPLICLLNTIQNLFKI